MLGGRPSREGAGCEGTFPVIRRGSAGACVDGDTPLSSLAAGEGSPGWSAAMLIDVLVDAGLPTVPPALLEGIVVFVGDSYCTMESVR